MCWMTIQRSDDGTAMQDTVDALKHGEGVSGGHSWGLAIPTPDGLRLMHGLGRLPEQVEKMAEQYDADICLGHTRFATRGEVNLANAHPFEIKNRQGETVAAVAHNGTWYAAPDTDRADSYYIARLVESLVMGGETVEDALEHAGQITGETLVALTADGEGYAYSGRFEITAADGDCIASSGETPIPDGVVRAL